MRRSQVIPQVHDRLEPGAADVPPKLRGGVSPPVHQGQVPLGAAGRVEPPPALQALGAAVGEAGDAAVALGLGGGGGGGGRVFFGVFVARVIRVILCKKASV